MTTLEKLTVGTVAIAGLKLLVGGAVITWGAKTLQVGMPDAGAIGAVLGPVLAAYAASLHKSFRDADGDGKPDPEPPEKP